MTRSQSPPQDRIDPILAYIATLDPERDLTAKAVGWRMRRAGHHIDTIIRRRLATEGIELWEVEILCGLRREGGTLTMGELQDITQLTSGAVTNRISRLEREGFVQREVDVEDRRQVLVTITSAGRERSNEVVKANAAAEKEAFEGIDRDLLDRLAEDLRELVLATEGPDPRQ